MRVVDGRYLIERKLGEGGMGAVYLARDTTLDILVALKVLNQNGWKKTTSELLRFVREAQLPARLNHPNIARVYNAGEAHRKKPILEKVLERFDLLEREDAVQPYIAMEYVPGESLDMLLKREAPNFKTSSDFAMQIAAGLAHAHEQGIIHRDIKPSNIIIGENGAKIVDFGIARQVEGGTITQPGMQPGTPVYMSPEQTRGEKVDCRTDIYSLGAVLYEMLTGHMPFNGEDLNEIKYNVVNQEPIPPREIDSSIPSELENITLKALRKDRNERYQHVEELKEELQELFEQPELYSAQRRQSQTSLNRPGVYNSLAPPNEPIHPSDTQRPHTRRPNASGIDNSVLGQVPMSDIQCSDNSNEDEDNLDAHEQIYTIVDTGTLSTLTLGQYVPVQDVYSRVQQAGEKLESFIKSKKEYVGRAIKAVSIELLVKAGFILMSAGITGAPIGCTIAYKLFEHYRTPTQIESPTTSVPQISEFKETEHAETQNKSQKQLKTNEKLAAPTELDQKITQETDLLHSKQNHTSVVNVQTELDQYNTFVNIITTQYTPETPRIEEIQTQEDTLGKKIRTNNVDVQYITNTSPEQREETLSLNSEPLVYTPPPFEQVQTPEQEPEFEPKVIQREKPSRSKPDTPIRWPEKPTRSYRTTEKETVRVKTELFSKQTPFENSEHIQLRFNHNVRLNNCSVGAFSSYHGKNSEIDIEENAPNLHELEHNILLGAYVAIHSRPATFGFTLSIGGSTFERTSTDMQLVTSRLNSNLSTFGAGIELDIPNTGTALETRILFGGGNYKTELGIEETQVDVTGKTNTHSLKLGLTQILFATGARTEKTNKFVYKNDFPGIATPTAYNGLGFLINLAAEIGKQKIGTPEYESGNLFYASGRYIPPLSRSLLETQKWDVHADVTLFNDQRTFKKNGVMGGYMVQGGIRARLGEVARKYFDGHSQKQTYNQFGILGGLALPIGKTTVEFNLEAGIQIGKQETILANSEPRKKQTNYFAAGLKFEF